MCGRIDRFGRSRRTKPTMSEDLDSDDEISFGPRSPPLTDQIASVLRRYPDGGQILKELIQNADDAGASEVRFLLDPRQHSTALLLEDGLSGYQGPALYAWNDAVFKKDDWECLAKIEQSNKKKELLKVGRFGLGFLSVFHITDLPVIISKKRVGIADPHQRLQLVCQNSGGAGEVIKLTEFLQHKGHAQCLRGIFELQENTKSYDATLFRFPLRQENAASKISNNYYTPAKVRDNLFSSLKEEAPLLLLFLKNVLKVGIYEWNEETNSTTCTFSVKISENVSLDRARCTSLAKEYDRNSSTTSVVLGSATTTTWCVGEEHNNFHWLMLHAIGSDLQEVRERADKAKVLPWVGIAAPAPVNFSLTSIEEKLERASDVDSVKRAVSRQSVLSKLSQKDVCEVVDTPTTAGQAFCFLPLPGSIALPVNLHGYFAVADNRRSIKWPSHDENGEEAKWNELLLCKLVSPLYALLLACRSSLIHYQGTSVDKPTNDAYAAWPVYAEIKNQQIWSNILEPVLSRIIDLPVLWAESSNGGAWVAPQDATFIKPNEECPHIALKILLNLGRKVVFLPHNIHETMLTNDTMKSIIHARYVSAELVRDAMRKKSNLLNSFPRDQVYELLMYLLSHIHNCHELKDLEVLPLCDSSKFSTFNGEKVFLFPEQLKDCMNFLPGIEGSVVDTKIPFGLQEKLEEMSRNEQVQLTLVSPDTICGRLIQLSMNLWCPHLQSVHLYEKCIWQPGVSNHPPAEWITNVWDWIRKSQRVDKVIDIPLVPEETVTPSTNRVCLWPLSTSPKLCRMPTDRHPERCPEDVMLEIVKKAGLVYIQQSDYIFQCPGIDQYIKVCDARFLLQRIREQVKSFSNTLSATEKDSLRLYIAHDLYASHLSREEANTIKSLPIFKAGVGGSSPQLISLVSARCVLPPQGVAFQGNIEYPPAILCGDDDLVNSLLEKLDVPRSKTIDEFCEKVVLPYVLQSQQWSQNGENLIMWVLQCPLTNPKFLKNFRIVKTCVSRHQRSSPAELYDPNEHVFSSLFDSENEAVFPADDYKPVLPTLRQAGLRSWSDIINDRNEMIGFFMDRAKSISTLNKEEGLKRSKLLLPHLLQQRLFQNPLFLNIPFLFPQPTPPANYPTGLKWFGELKAHAMAPKDICCSSSSVLVAGSVVPFLPSEYNLFEEYYDGFRKISSMDIVSHFKEVVQYTDMPNSSRNNVHDMVMRIYSSLCAHKPTKITDFPEKWIWWKPINKFLRPDQCIVRLPTEIVTLEPHLFSLCQDPGLKDSVLFLQSLLSQVKLQESLTKEHAVMVLKSIKQPEGKRLTPEEINMTVQILKWLKNDDGHTHGDIFIPTSHCTLVPPSECTYDDRSWKPGGPLIQKSKYTFVHDDIPPALAKHFKVVPLSMRVAPSKPLKIKFTQAGQHQPITLRIKRIVEDYATGSDIFKELLQNADDAKATEVKFLIDWRKHPTSQLLANKLEEWQGPALIAYNNAVFSDQDFDHICELDAATKMSDPHKTGRFGVGFCATYRITDVPSFISRRYFTMFDPHTVYLGDRVSESDPGMRIDLVENREDLSIYSHQFEPYNGLFGCDVFNLKDDGYKGTLFRFPFRSHKTAYESKICNEVNDKRRIEMLLQEFKEQAPYLLLFLKHIRKISMYVLDSREKQMKKIIEVTKTCQCLPSCNRLSLIGSEKQLEDVETNTCHCTVECEGTSTSQWIICSSVTPSVKPGEEEKHGLVPFAEVAFKVSKEASGGLSPVTIEGYAFCFLPLPRKTGLCFHVNGFFEISRDRSGLKSADDGRFGKEWNDSLCKEPLMHAYISALAELAQMSPLKLQHCLKEDMKKHRDKYYDMFKLTDNKDFSTLRSAVQEGLPKSEAEIIWSDVNGGQWLKPSDVVILDFGPGISARSMYKPAVDVMLKLKHSVCELPQHLEKLLISVLRKTTPKQVYSCKSFYTDIFLPNISEIEEQLRDKHILFLLKNVDRDRFEWIETLLRDETFVPVKACTHLVTPNYLIDDRQPMMARLYDIEEGRFPEEYLTKDERAMVSLAQLGMPKKLSIQHIKERAHTVITLFGHISSRQKAFERSWNLLKYIETKYYGISRPIELSNALSNVPFLPVAHKPYSDVPWYETDELVKPCSVFPPKWNHMIFSERPVVLQPEKYQLNPDILVLIGASQEPPLDLVITHLLNLSQASTEFSQDALSFITEAMGDIYNYIQSKVKVYGSSDLELVKKRLKEVKFIWQGNRFLKADQVVLKWGHNCYPYLCELSSENCRYKDLFVPLGVKESPSVDDLISILCRIAGQPISKSDDTDEAASDSEMVESNALGFIEEIVKILCTKPVKSEDDYPLPNLYLPDDNCVMRPVKQLACDRVNTGNEEWVQSIGMFTSQFEGGACCFIHPNIPRERAIKLGVKPLLDALLRGLEDEDFMKGLDYGQHEDLCDRLKSIVRKYPADHSILNEFVQNADDAQATEIVFILDRRKYPQDKLFPSKHNSWRDLQETPALCIMNNRKFTEEDIKGIAKLGRGGKRDSSDTIGKFGIGFNVAYHVTDCPSFLSFSEASEPESFCVFDPTCSFTNATQRDPGKRWKLTPQTVNDLPCQFQPYMFKNLSTPILGDLAKGHVVFRLPLTRKRKLAQTPYYGHGSVYRRTMSGTDESKKWLSSAVDAEGVIRIFKDMKTYYACDTLLFLNHITKISAFEIRENGDILKHFSTSRDVSTEVEANIHDYAREIKEMTKQTRTPQRRTLTYETEVVHEEGVKSTECAQQTLRLRRLICRNYSPIQQSDEDTDSEEGTEEWNMRPIGGIAAPMGDAPIKGRLFCFLPMPLESKLPVHVNGHFLVDDSRKHLERLRKERVNWNESLAEKVIAPCYVDLLLHAQQMTEKGESDPKWFYSLFPSLSLAGEVGNLKLAETIYKILFQRNPTILLQKNNGICKWFNLQGSNMGYFFKTYVSEITQRSVEADPKLQQALIRLGMPITTTEVPLSLHDRMRKVTKNYRAIVEPITILNHMKHMPRNVQDILTTDIIQLLLTFLLSGMNIGPFKKALRTVPLLLSSGNHLRRGEEIFQSEYAALLPQCSEYFIHKELEESSVGTILKRDQYKVIVNLPVTFVSEHIDLRNAQQPMEISQTPAETMKLIKNLWKYLNSLILITNDGVKSLFSQKQVLPADNGYFYPMCKSDAIICRYYGERHIRSVLVKLGYPTVSFKALDISAPLAITLGNKCSDGKDIVDCFNCRAPPKMDADLSPEEVRCLIESVRCQDLGYPVQKILQSLKIFKAVDGAFMSMEGCSHVYIMPNSIPRGGIGHIQRQCRKFVILDGVDQFTIDFYTKILQSHYYISPANRIQFYRQVILPHLCSLELDHLQEHLRCIYANKELKNELKADLRNMKLITLSDGVCYRIDEIYDPKNNFFATFCSNKLLPDPWKGEEMWFSFFKELGLHHEVEIQEWIHHAEHFAEHHDSSSMTHKSNNLFDTLIDILNKSRPSKILLKRVSTIQFIHNNDIPELITAVQHVFGNHQSDLVSQKRSLFCFKGSVMSKHSNLAALCRNVLPSNYEERLRGGCDLAIEFPVEATTVVNNLKELSTMYTCIHSSQQGTSRLRNIVTKHFIALNAMSNLSSHDIIASLKETLCIAICPPGDLALVKPSQLVRMLPSDVNVEPFRYAVPPDISECTRLLDVWDVPHELSAKNCADILRDIYQQLQQIKKKLSCHDKFKKIALDAYKHMVCSLRKKDETLPDTIYLPSEDDDLVPNSDLLFNDAMWYAQRVNYKFLKLPPHNDKGEKIPPNSLGVKKLTSVVSEELHDDMLKSELSCVKEELYDADNSRQRCQAVQSLRDTFYSPELKTGLRRVYYSEHKERPSDQFERALDNLPGLEIKCVISPRIVTVLKRNGTAIPKSKCRDKCCHVSVERNHLIIAPHDQSFDQSEFIQNLSSALKELLNNEIKNEAYLMAVLKCEPRQIEAELDKLKVSLYDPDSIKETKYRQIGDDVALSNLTLEDCLIILNFHAGEMVYFYDTSRKMTTAKVVQVKASKDLWEKSITLCVKNEEEGEEEERKVSVSPLLIFKMLTPPQQIMLFSNEEKSSTIQATAEPVQLAQVPLVKTEIDSFLRLSKCCRIPQQLLMMRLISHVHFQLAQRDKKPLHNLRETAEKFLARLSKFQSCVRCMTAQHILEIATKNWKMEIPSSGSLRDCGVMPPLSSADNVTCSLPQGHPVTPSGLSSQTTPSTSSLPPGPPVQPVYQSSHSSSTSSSSLQSRFQPQQRTRGHYRPQPSRHRFGFQARTTRDAQPQTPPPPPTSETSAKIWLDQAKMDFKAACFLAGSLSVTPTIVSQPAECVLEDEQVIPEEVEDGGGVTSNTTPVEDEWEMQLNAASSSDISSIQDKEEAGAGSSDVSSLQERGEMQLAAASSSNISSLEEGAGEEQLDKSSSSDSDSIHEKVHSVEQSDSSNVEFPALVCFLCHEAAEKCIKGVMYAYCGLNMELVNCSILVTLMDELKRSRYCPQSLLPPIEQCVMQVNEHQNRSRFPNFQIPPCAPASVYTCHNAHEAITAVNQLFSSLKRDLHISELLGSIEEVSVPHFTSMLSSLPANDEYPSYWDELGDNENFKLCLLDPCSGEYQAIEDSFFATLLNVEIIRIERIQNCVSWKKYMDKSREMRRFGGEELNEKLLFHGSSSNNPEDIYKGDASFDMRMSSHGMWGRGNYFAVNASYSHNFAFQRRSTAMPCRIMLAAWVLTGQSYTSDPRQFSSPPFRTDCVEQGGVRRRYDSVNGSTGGSKVYITYDNTLAYPAYVITYVTNA